MQRLIGCAQNYVWGSRTMLSSLRGDGPSDLPEAEIWYGAHAVAPSTFDDGTTLLAAIDADATAQVGPENVAMFGRRLPFLLKLLAAASPLSLQAHPTADQAIAGFADDEAEGIARDAAHRIFRDDNHKPELIVAVTPFEALVGFRDPVRSVALLDALAAPDGLVSLVAGEGPKAAMKWLLDPKTSAHRNAVAACISALVAGATNYVGDTWMAEAALVLRLTAMYPADPGIGVAALLNLVELEPGEGLFLGAGTLHSYVSGLGVEVLANSDNVVRGGLTQKHVDVPTLITVVRPDCIDPTPVDLVAGQYSTSVPEFRLTRITPAGATPVTGPAIVLCVSGTTRLSGNDQLELTPTEAAWIPTGETVGASTSDLGFVAEVGDLA
ncbi:MAG: mannose-6-phosphate isomerase, class I [Acidimicrobiales bacterium]